MHHSSSCMWKRLSFHLLFGFFLVSFISMSHLYFIYKTIHQNSIKTIVVVHTVPCSHIRSLNYCLENYLCCFTERTANHVYNGLNSMWKMLRMWEIWDVHICVMCGLLCSLGLFLNEFCCLMLTKIVSEFRMNVVTFLSCWEILKPSQIEWKSVLNGMEFVSSFNVQFLHNSNFVCTSMRRWQS